MDPASSQPGSAPIEYQVQPPTDSPSSSSSSIHDSSCLQRPASRPSFNQATLETCSSVMAGPSAGLGDTRPQSNLSQGIQSLNPEGTLRLSSESDEHKRLDSPASTPSSLDTPKEIAIGSSSGNLPPISQIATVPAIKDHSTVIEDNNGLYGGGIDRASSTPASTPMSSKPNKSVSRLCFPFVTSASRRKKAPPVPPPTRHKYSCIHPTLMAPYHPGKVFPVQQRHQYQHHGHSRHGIERLRAFWAEKFTQHLPEGQSDNSEEQRSNAQARLASLYDMDQTVVERPATIHPRAARDSQGSQAQHHLPPMTIHPRRGDIMALHDPYCMQIDRQFVNLPTWTIGKTIWMQDLHIASEQRRDQLETSEPTDKARSITSPVASAASDVDEDEDPHYDDCASTDAESEVDVTSFSTGFSDDSDATLVESESETDLPRLGSVKPRNAFYHWATEGSSSSRRAVSLPTGSFSTSSSDSICSLHSSPLSASSHTSISDMNIDADIDLSSWSQTLYKSSNDLNSLLEDAQAETRQQTTHSRQENESEDNEELLSTTPPTTPTAPKRSSTPVQTHICAPGQSWQTNWYRRWELLVDLTKKERQRKHALPCSCPSTPLKDDTPKGPKFFLNAAHSDDEDDHDELEQDWRTQTRSRTMSA